MEYDVCVIWDGDELDCFVVCGEETVYNADDVTEWDEDGWPLAFEDEDGDEYELYDED